MVINDLHGMDFDGHRVEFGNHIAEAKVNEQALVFFRDFIAGQILSKVRRLPLDSRAGNV